MSRKHVHDRIDRLARRLADAEAELAALRAWKESHACAPLSYQPALIPPAQACTCGATSGWCPQHGTGRWQQPFIWSGDPHISTVTIPAGQWTAINTAGAAPVTSTLTVTRPALRLAWPPKNPPDDPDMGVPALA